MIKLRKGSKVKIMRELGLFKIIGIEGTIDFMNDAGICIIINKHQSKAINFFLDIHVSLNDKKSILSGEYKIYISNRESSYLELINNNCLPDE